MDGGRLSGAPKRVNLQSFLDFDPGVLYVAHTLFSPHSERVAMAGLGELVRGLAAREGVVAVLLVSGDGLDIEHAGAPAEPETIAALSATVGQHAVRLGEGVGRGELRTAVLEYGDGLFVLARAGRTDWLAILAKPGTNLGELLYDLRHQRPTIANLL